MIVADGMVWFTQGGWETAASASNYSRVVAFDPTTSTMCTYDVPGDNANVIRVAAVGSGQQMQIWFAESFGNDGGGAIDYFQPSQIGDGCPGGAGGQNSPMS